MLTEPGKARLIWSPCGTPLLVVRFGKLPLTWMLKLVDGVTLNVSETPLACGAASSPPLTIRPGCWEDDAGPACTKLAVLRLTVTRAPKWLLLTVTLASETFMVS